jgi:hypothetical protein
MAAPYDVIARLRAHLETLRQVHCRPEFGNQVFYMGAVQFAALTDRAVLVHLPAAELTAVLRRGYARPFVSARAMGRNGWVEIALSGAPPEELERLLTLSHAAARRAPRRARPRPSRARRRSPGASA